MFSLADREAQIRRYARLLEILAGDLSLPRLLQPRGRGAVVQSGSRLRAAVQIRVDHPRAVAMPQAVGGDPRLPPGVLPSGAEPSPAPPQAS